MVPFQQTRLLSGRLWQRIQQPSPRNPLYERAAFRAYTPPNRLLDLLGEALDVLFASPLVMVTFPFIPVVLMLLNTINGMRVAAAASTIIHDEHQRGTLDLLTLIPSGRREAIWLLSLGAIHQTRAYHNLTLWRRYIGRMIPASITFYALLLVLNTLPDSDFTLTLLNGMFFLVIVPCITVVLFDHDNRQSLVSAAVAGLAVSTTTPRRGDVEGLAMILFLGGQLALYALLVVLLLVPLQRFSAHYFLANPDAWGGFLLQSTAYLLFVCGCHISLRDAGIRVLWRVYQQRLYG
jgi:hypothetical protein